MEGAPNAIAEFAKGLRPVGLFYGTFTSFLAFVVYCLRELPFAQWPEPLAHLLWLHMGATVLAIPYLHVVAIASKRTADAVQRASAAPTTTGPRLAEPTAPRAPALVDVAEASSPATDA